MFDPFKQAKIQNGYSKLKDTTIPERDMTLDELKKLSGSGQVTGEYSYTTLHELAQKKQQYMRENNIKPGDQSVQLLYTCFDNTAGNCYVASTFL